MNRLLRTAGDQWSHQAVKSGEFVELETAALSSGTNASFDASGHPCDGVTQKIRPGMVCFNMKGLDGRKVVPKAAVSTLFEE